MNAFYEHHRDSIRFGYRCFDPILLNEAVKPLGEEDEASSASMTRRMRGL
jgi:hypothetical protein